MVRALPRLPASPRGQAARESRREPGRSDSRPASLPLTKYLTQTVNTALLVSSVTSVAPARQRPTPARLETFRESSRLGKAALRAQSRPVCLLSLAIHTQNIPDRPIAYVCRTKTWTSPPLPPTRAPRRKLRLPRLLTRAMMQWLRQLISTTLHRMSHSQTKTGLLLPTKATRALAWRSPRKAASR